MFDRDWLYDIPISRKAYFEEVDVMWAPKFSRAWKLQMENFLWYDADCKHVIERVKEEFDRVWRVMSIKNRRRPRRLRRIGNAAKRKEAFFKIVYKRLKPIYESTFRVHCEVYQMFSGQWNNPYLGPAHFYQ